MSSHIFCITNQSLGLYFRSNVQTPA